MGMASITIREAPESKLRVTCFSWTAPLPQLAHWRSAEIDGDDEEFAREADFDDRFGRLSMEGDAFNDALDFARSRIPLPGCDLAREDDVFKVEDSEVVIFKLFGGVG